MSENRIQQAIARRLQEKKQIINLSFADYTFYDSLLNVSRIRNSFVNILKYPYYYPTARGEISARQAISHYYKKFGQTVSPERILLTSTLNQAYLYLIKLFGADKGQILVARPHTPALEEVASFLGQKIKYFTLDPNDHWQIDLNSIHKALTPKTRAIFISSPHLPTGAIQTPETLAALFDLIKGKNITLIVDESLSDFIFNKKDFPITESLADSSQNIISLQTLSNGFALPGFKLAWLTFFGPESSTKTLYQSIEYLADTFLTLNQLSQTVLPEVIKYSETWRYKFAKQIEKNSKIIAESLKKNPHLKFHPPDGGLYGIIEILGAENKDQEIVIELLKQTGIYLHPGFYYGFDQACYLIICFLQDPKILRNSLRKIGKFFKIRAKKRG